MNEGTERQKTLVFVLRILGTIDVLAVFAVFMPREGMALIHAWLGMNQLPDAPIIGYLTRSASSLYALHGAILLFLSTDVRRYSSLITFLAFAALVHGVVLFLIDLVMEMPVFWTCLEGPAVAASGTVVLMIQPDRREASM